MTKPRKRHKKVLLWSKGRREKLRRWKSLKIICSKVRVNWNSRILMSDSINYFRDLTKSGPTVGSTECNDKDKLLIFIGNQLEISLPYQLIYWVDFVYNNNLNGRSFGCWNHSMGANYHYWRLFCDEGGELSVERTEKRIKQDVLIQRVRVALVSIILVGVQLWMMWITCYMHQMYPLVQPKI